MQACTAAREALLAEDLQSAESLLVEALRYRPSCALAYKLFGDLFTAQESPDAANLCYRNLLPDSVLAKHFPVDNKLLNECPAYLRTEVFAQTNVRVPSAGGIDNQSGFTAQTVESAPGYVDVVSAGALWHDDLNTIVLENAGIELKQHTVGAAAMLRSLCSRSKPMSVDGRVILLGAKGAHNFYHWTTDIIPKIGLLMESGVQLKPTDTFIVSRANATFARQLLAVFDIAADQIMETESTSPFISADELLIPYLQNKMGYTMSAWLPRFLKSIMSVDVSQQSERRLFVSRNPATAAGRTLTNTQQVENWFTENGFEVVYPETLCVKEQAQLFSSAKVVAGVHGAGLSNIVYCGQGTKVIEFYGAHIAPCYWIISALSALDYFNHHCVGAEANGSQHGAGFELRLTEARAVLAEAGVL